MIPDKYMFLLILMWAVKSIAEASTSIKDQRSARNTRAIKYPGYWNAIETISETVPDEVIQFLYAAVEKSAEKGEREAKLAKHYYEVLKALRNDYKPITKKGPRPLNKGSRSRDQERRSKDQERRPVDQERKSSQVDVPQLRSLDFSEEGDESVILPNRNFVPEFIRKSSEEAENSSMDCD